MEDCVVDPNPMKYHGDTTRHMSYFTGFWCDFRPGMQTFIPLSVNACLNQSASWPPVAQKLFRRRQTAQQSRRADLIAGVFGRHEEPDRPPIRISNGVQLGVHVAFGGQAHHDPGEDAVVAPAFPTIVEDLCRA